MHYYSLMGKDVVSVDEILSRYLWDQTTPPSPSELNDERFIRGNKQLGSPLTIDTETYMKTGPGRFVSAADVELFEDFFNTEFAQGTYSHAEIWKKLRPNTEKPQESYAIDVSQYYTGIGSPDYVTRAFIFGSTKFIVDFTQVKYIVHENGTKELQNVKILPAQLVSKNPKHKENFDFVGNGKLINLLNGHFEPIIDPSSIGRLVPVEFSNTDKVQAVNIDQDLFNKLKDRKELLSEYDSTNYEQLAGYLAIIETKIISSDAVLNKDDKGRRVIYDGKNTNEIDVKKALEKLNTLGFISEKVRAFINSLTNNTGYSLIGGNGNDTLIGSDLDDLLNGGKDNDILNGGKGNDAMEGGEGHDIYYIGGNDTVIDEDGKGEIRFLDKDYKIKPEELSDSVSARRLSELQGWITSYNPSDSSAVFESHDSNNEITHRFEAKGIKLLDSSKTKKDWYGFYDPIVISDFSAESLIITELATGHQVTIKDFVNLQLGITLIDSLLGSLCVCFWLLL